jgi:hypothetical protein
MWHIARQGCCTSHCPFGRAMAASQPDRFGALGSVCYCSAHGSYSLHSWSSVVITDLAHKASNQSMNPTKFFSRSHDAVIRVYDDAGNVTETHEHKGEFKEW